jgi:hypothetical protein
MLRRSEFLYRAFNQDGVLGEQHAVVGQAEGGEEPEPLLLLHRPQDALITLKHPGAGGDLILPDHGNPVVVGDVHEGSGVRSVKDLVVAVLPFAELL